MMSVKVWEKEAGDLSARFRPRHDETRQALNPCGGCTLCHQMTRIHRPGGPQPWPGTEPSAGLELPCAGRFFQRHLGNRHLQHLGESAQRDRGTTQQANSHTVGLGPAVKTTAPAIQTKLIIGEPGDEYEQEADRIDEQVMRMPAPFMPDEPGKISATAMPRLRRACAGCESEEEDETLQAKRSASQGGFLSNHEAPPIVRDVLRTSGQPLAEAVRREMGPRFGRDFGQVRIHTDSRAAESARAVDALAYTVGRDIVFAEGQYAPDTNEGRHLLAHELTHILQQTSTRQIQRTIGDGHDLSSNRFKGNVKLEEAYDDETPIQKGARGLHVVILQQALVDAGFPLPVFGVDGKFEDETQTGVEAFQTSKGLTGSDVDGIVDQRTMGLLDQHFLHHAPERALAANPTRALMEGTRSLTATERAGVRSAITTEIRTPSGALPTFRRVIPANPDPYEVRIRDRLNQAITGLFNALVASRPPRVAANMMTAADVDRLAQRAKAVTDVVYGRYRTGPALAFGLNIFDQYVQRSNVISASPANEDRAANWRVMKLLDGDDDIRDIDREHGAVQRRPTEWSLIAGVTGFPNQPPGVLNYEASPPHVTTGIVGTRRAQLLDIHRNWPASAGSGEIYLQMYLGTGPAANRNLMYEVFSTIIHEYIHTLEHPRHQTYSQSLGEQRGGFVLREGMTDYLAKVVWDSLTFDAALRSAIEDRFQDPANPLGHPIPLPDRYTEWTNAERMVGIVGIRNALAAFFLGRTDLIGGP